MARNTGTHGVFKPPRSLMDAVCFCSVGQDSRLPSGRRGGARGHEDRRDKPGLLFACATRWLMRSRFSRFVERHSVAIPAVVATAVTTTVSPPSRPHGRMPSFPQVFKRESRVPRSWAGAGFCSIPREVN